MIRARVAAAACAILTALLLQGTLIGPWTLPVPVSLPAVMVAAVALVDGPGAGMAFGFSTGLIADLASDHPAGVLALSWMAVGLLCGLASDRNSVRRAAATAATAAVVCALAGLLTGVLLVLLHADGADLRHSLEWMLPAGVGEALLALAVVPAVRAFLRSNALRAPHPGFELSAGGRRG